MSRITLGSSLAASMLVAMLAGCAQDVTSPTDPVVVSAPTTLARGGSEPLPGGAVRPSQLLDLISRAFDLPAVPGYRLYVSSFCDSSGPTTPAFRAFNSTAVLHEWAATTNLDPPDPTDLAFERRFYQWLRQSHPHKRMSFRWVADPYSPADVIDDAHGTATLYRGYLLSVTLPKRGTSILIAYGNVTLDLVRISGQWQVRTWNDRINPSLPFPPSGPGQVSLGWLRLMSVLGN